jgi:NADH dehydrogenase
LVGCGFGDLTAAKALARLPVRLTLIDLRNHHLFQPLLYQVATAGLSPADIQLLFLIDPPGRGLGVDVLLQKSVSRISPRDTAVG